MSRTLTQHAAALKAAGFIEKDGQLVRPSERWYGRSESRRLPYACIRCGDEYSSPIPPEETATCLDGKPCDIKPNPLFSPPSPIQGPTTATVAKPIIHKGQVSTCVEPSGRAKLSRKAAKAESVVSYAPVQSKTVTPAVSDRIVGGDVGELASGSHPCGKSKCELVRGIGLCDLEKEGLSGSASGQSEARHLRPDERPAREGSGPEKLFGAGGGVEGHARNVIGQLPGKSRVEHNEDKSQLRSETASRNQARPASASYNVKIVQQYFMSEGVPVPTAEYRFDSKRKWRFDFAWPELKVALEVEGGIWKGGGGAHSHPVNIMRDIEKYNAAACLGWRILRVMPENLCLLETVQMVKKAMMA